MNVFSFEEIRLIIAKSTKNNNNTYYPYGKNVAMKPKFASYRISLIKTLKTYVKKYCKNSDKYNVLYLSILYMDLILTKNKISLSNDKNLKYLCLCCFLLSLKFIGNYDTSKKVISNFCKNYPDEYKIFEIQCIMLLEHNLVQTTTFDYLNMILINEPKKILNECNSILYQICEDNLYTFYSPFYISIAIFKVAKYKINYNNHNHYDKYFHDERVKTLLKKINYLINPPSIKNILINENKLISDDINNNILNKTITNTNINIISNNSIHNNIVIINTICKKKSDNFFNKNASHFMNSTNTPIKVNFSSNSDNKINNHINKVNDIQNNVSEYSNNDGLDLKKISKNNISKSHFKLCRTNKNNIYNNHKTVTIKEIKNKKDNNKINASFNSSNNLSNINKNYYEKNSFEIKKCLYYNNKEESFSTSIQTPNHFMSNNIDKKGIISSDKSSLNFQLVSGVSKEKLFKLSRNLSKSLISLNEKPNQKGKNIK